MDFAKMMERLASADDDNRPATNWLKGEERETVAAGFKHIEGLKPGDKVRWKRGYIVSKTPAIDEVVEVFEVYPPRRGGAEDSGNPYFDQFFDFTVAFRDRAGDILMHTYDSRRFERVV